VASELALTSRDFPSIRRKRSRSAAGRPPRVGSRGSVSEDGQTLDAGIAAKAHYLDITGEINVLEGTHHFDAKPLSFRWEYLLLDAPASCWTPALLMGEDFILRLPALRRSICRIKWGRGSDLAV
jgi:short subunit dehydrogenase-like uncharacterized protein